MCRRQNVILTLQKEATGDREQHTVSPLLLQGTLCSPFPKSEKYEIVLQEEDSRGLEAQKYPLGTPWNVDNSGSKRKFCVNELQNSRGSKCHFIISNNPE